MVQYDFSIRIQTMYSGMDKYGGQVVGTGTKSTSGDSLEETLESAAAEETIVLNVPCGATTVPVLLQSHLNSDAGGLVWIEVDDPASTFNSVVAMSQMTSMLRDSDRNSKYAAGIAHAIQRFRATVRAKQLPNHLALVRDRQRRAGVDIL